MLTHFPTADTHGLLRFEVCVCRNLHKIFMENGIKVNKVTSKVIINKCTYFAVSRHINDFNNVTHANIKPHNLTTAEIFPS